MEADGRTPAASVSYRDVTKRYPGQSSPAINHLSLEIPAGDICVLVGPSGCGKTTAMRMLNRTVEITEGDILIGDPSIVFTSDAQLSANPDKYVLLQDDKGIFPSGNVIWVTDQSTVQKAGPDYMATIEKVQKGLTLPVMQELNARVDIDKQDPAAVATEYLKEDGYVQ